MKTKTSKNLPSKRQKLQTTDWKWNWNDFWSWSEDVKLLSVMATCHAV